MFVLFNQPVLPVQSTLYHTAPFTTKANSIVQVFEKKRDKQFLWEIALNNNNLTRDRLLPRGRKDV